ncbi:DUF2512 family protein [Bacillus sp. JCM 19034]|uniref:DUF2512 family protein n=1 Tax=Bacillus sp. JCM 19034 TaxID=1481928 RepID=UPI0007848FEE|nr:DUF2512 family protein [Bacillus sp. JCM 19034]
MKHVGALIVKTLMVTLVLLVIMSYIYGYPAGDTFGLSLLIVGISYIVGDMGILRVSNNAVATLADLGLTTIAIWLIGPLIYGYGVPFSIAFISALIIGIGEWFFHKFVANGILQKEPSPQT